MSETEEPKNEEEKPASEEIPQSGSFILGQGELSGDRVKSGASSKPEMPPALRILLGKYLEITLKLISSPLGFFKSMDRSSELTEPAMFLAVSSVSSVLLSTIINLDKFNLFGIPGKILMEIAPAFMAAGIVYFLSKSMGCKTNYATVFRVFAYCSFLAVINPIPGVGFLTPVCGLVLTFFGLKEVLELPMSKMLTVMFLVGFFQIIVGIGRIFSH